MKTVFAAMQAFEPISREHIFPQIFSDKLYIVSALLCVFCIHFVRNSPFFQIRIVRIAEKGTIIIAMYQPPFSLP